MRQLTQFLPSDKLQLSLLLQFLFVLWHSAEIDSRSAWHLETIWAWLTLQRRDCAYSINLACGLERRAPQPRCPCYLSLFPSLLKFPAKVLQVPGTSKPCNSKSKKYDFTQEIRIQTRGVIWIMQNECLQIAQLRWARSKETQILGHGDLSRQRVRPAWSKDYVARSSTKSNLSNLSNLCTQGTTTQRHSRHRWPLATPLSLRVTNELSRPVATCSASI